RRTRLANSSGTALPWSCSPEVRRGECSSVLLFTAARVADFRPEMTNDVISGVRAQGDTRRTEAAGDSVKRGGLPQAGDQSASKHACNFTGRDGAFAGGGLARDHGADKGISQPRTRAFLS